MFLCPSLSWPYLCLTVWKYEANDWFKNLWVEAAEEAEEEKTAYGTLSNYSMKYLYELLNTTPFLLVSVEILGSRSNGEWKEDISNKYFAYFFGSP